MGSKHFVASTDELDGDGSSAIVEIKGQEIAVFNKNGDYYAVANYCPHQAGPLCEGKLKGETSIGDDGWELVYGEETLIECPWHTWAFDIKTGKHVADDRYAVPTYDVVVEDEEIYVIK